MMFRQKNSFGGREATLAHFRDNEIIVPMIELAYQLNQKRTTSERRAAAAAFRQVWFEMCVEDLS